MKAEYKRDVSHNYLILEEEEGIDTSSYQVRMLAGNVIPSLLHCRLQNLDGKLFFYYEITSRQSLSSYYEEKKFKAEDVRLIFGGFVQVMEELAEYLLNPEQLLLRPEYIYLDIEKRQVFFCCFPGSGTAVQDQLRELMEYMLPKLDHEDQAAVFLGYGIYRKMLEPGFQMENIKEAVYHRDKEELPPEEGQDREMENRRNHDEGSVPESRQVEERSYQEPECRDQKSGDDIRFIIIGCAGALAVTAILLAGGILGYLPWIPAELVMGCGIAAVGTGGFAAWRKEKIKKKKERNRIFSEGTYHPTAPEIQFDPMKYAAASRKTIGFAGTAGILRGDRSALFGIRTRTASLVSREPGELATIYLEQEFTVVGKMTGAADAVIPVSTVSRIHARIRRRDNEYYLEDLNSRNGTSVNGHMLKNEEEYQLQDEDEVDFAQARYIFVGEKRWQKDAGKRIHGKRKPACQDTAYLLQ